MMDTQAVDRHLACALRSLRASDDAQWPFAQSSDWKLVWGRIEYHGIVLVLFHAIDRLADWPQDLLNRLTEEARLITLWEATHHKLVSQCIEALADHGVASVVMKGTALAYAFHDEPATRRRGDTDLLVRPETLDATRQTLTSLGWTRKDEPHGLYFQEGWQHEAAGFFLHSIDLHWKPVDRPVLHDVLPIERVFDGRKEMPRFGKGAFRSDTPTMVLHAVINQKWHAEHGYYAEDGRLQSPRRLIWSIDFDLMIRALTDEDWDLLTDHCITQGIAPLVADALEGMREDLGTTLPEARIERLKSAELAPDLKSYFDDPDSLVQFRLDLRNTKGLSGKMKLLLSRAFPPRKHLVEKYPEASGWPTVLLQGRMLVETAGRLVRHKQS